MSWQPVNGAASHQGQKTTGATHPGNGPQTGDRTPAQSGAEKDQSQASNGAFQPLLPIDLDPPSPVETAIEAHVERVVEPTGDFNAAVSEHNVRTYNYNGFRRAAPPAQPTTNDMGRDDYSHIQPTQRNVRYSMAHNHPLPPPTVHFNGTLPSPPQESRNAVLPGSAPSFTVSHDGGLIASTNGRHSSLHCNVAHGTAAQSGPGSSTEANVNKLRKPRSDTVATLK
jgi:hypothetical protein